MSFSKEVKEELSKLNNLANKKEIESEFYGYLINKFINYTDLNYKIFNRK